MKSRKPKAEKPQMHDDSRLAKLMEPRYGLYLLAMLVFAGVTAYFNHYAGAAEAAVTVLLFVGYRLNARSRRQEISRYIAAASGDIGAAGNDFMLNAPFPMMIFRPDTREILWSNDRFLHITGEREHLFDTKITSVIPDFDYKWLTEGKSEAPSAVRIGERQYTVYGHLAKANGRNNSSGIIATTYWLDVTDELALKNEYYSSRPIVAILTIDNYEEMTRSLRDDARAALRSAIDQRIDAWIKPTGGLLVRYDRDRYLFVFEERHLAAMQESKFTLLDSVRQITSPNGLPVSLSIGIGMDSGYEELFHFAELAIDMAFSRGGDQAVIKNRFNFEFYGGRAKETERRTKVKSRVMATALGSLISSASRVYVMGHVFTDLDSIGAAAGIIAIARKLGTPAQIVVEQRPNPSDIMVERLKTVSEYKDVFISPDTALVEADSHSVLVVVDTNRPDQVVAKPLLLSCNKVAVIDHHRRSASYIDHADFNYHETYASSASELVTELIEYLLESTDLLQVEAEALLAGIVLDTKSFTLRTGGGTFEAAAFLRRCGADTTEVKCLFQSNLTDTIAKFDIIACAQLYRDGVMIACVDHMVDRVSAAQAADELLNVAGAAASFVLFPDDQGRVILSGRSIGKVNVQVILEVLGGGGNAAAAGAQVPDSDLTQVHNRLKTAIDRYFDE